jgi:hypothetical protein
MLADVGGVPQRNRLFVRASRKCDIDNESVRDRSGARCGKRMIAGAVLVIRRSRRLQWAMTMSAALLWLCLFTVIGQQPTARYFKEDHLTGADYFCLAANRTYQLTGREHMGIWALESGRWERSGAAIRFVPADKKKKAYTGTQGSHKGHTFLAFSEDAAPGLAMSVEEIKQGIDGDPKRLPSYVFFEIDRAAYERETKEAYPFRTMDVKVEIQKGNRAVTCVGSREKR